MGREVKRVALDFKWPMSKIWDGFLAPEPPAGLSGDERDAWYDNFVPTEPPAGDGWQVWETVSEGSPVTPVFATDEDLAHYLSTTGDDWSRDGKRALPTYDQALAFVRAGWAPSFALSGGVFRWSYGNQA